MRRWLFFFGALALALSFAAGAPEPADGASGKLCVTKGICHKVAVACSTQLNTVVLNVGTASWTVPTGVTTLSKLAAIGAGGGGSNGGGIGGGGGGEYREADNVAVTPGNALSLSIGSHGLGGGANSSGQGGTAGGDTSVSYLGSQILLAKGGGAGTLSVAGAGGTGGSGGTIHNNGGAGGGPGDGSGGGNGGGGAGGPHGAGGAGGIGHNASPPPYPGGNGGAGDAGSGGAGGAGSPDGSTAPGNGGNGTEFGTAGSGGGGGGGGLTGGTQNAAGSSGAYGAGGATPAYLSGNFLAGANGADGVVVVQFTACGGSPPPPPPNSFFVATNGNDSNPGTLAQPFLTFGQCQSAMRNSSTIKTCTIRAGTYNFGSTLTFTASDNGETWQYYSADGVNTAIIDGGTTVDLIAVNGVNNWTWNGIKLQHFATFGIYTPGNTRMTNLLVENSDIGFNTNNPATGGCIVMDNVTNSTYSHNYCHDVQQKGFTFFAFNSGDSYDGDQMIGNFAERTDLGESDDAPFYAENPPSNPGAISFIGNMARNYGNAGKTSLQCIYLDGNTSNATVKNNACGPPNSGLTSPSNNTSGVFVNGGGNNVVTGNLFDLGSTALQAAANWANNAGLSGASSNAGDTFTGNIVIMNFAGNNNTTSSGRSGFQFYQDGPTSDYTIQNNAYHQYGSGQLRTDGSEVNDASPQLYNATQIGVSCPNGIYTVAAGSTVTGAPVNFPALPTSFGPPGFTISRTGQESCT